MKTGALILASHDMSFYGEDNENFSPFLPMLPIEGNTVIKREIRMFRTLGLSPIYVLGGYLSGVLKNHLSHQNIILLKDPIYEEGNREGSLALALQEIWKMCDRVVSLPVEYPVCCARSVEALLQARGNARGVFQGRGELRLHVKGDAAEETAIPLPDVGLKYSMLDPGGWERVLVYAGTIREQNELRSHLKVVLSKKEDFFGPGIARLMQLIEGRGSLQSAAAAMEISYSKAWKMINKAESQLGFPLVARLNGGRGGGSSHLTEEGRQFVMRYQAMCQDLQRAAENFFDLYFSEFQ